MKLFNKKMLLLISSIALSAALVGCSAGGSCNTNVNPNPTITPSPDPTATPSPDPTVTPSPEPGTLSLAIAAPSQYPAGLPYPIIVPITMINTSDVDAKDLVYTVPNDSNYTKVVITPNPTGVAGNDCTNIPAGTSCDMTVTVAAYANPGSFKVVATPTVSTIAKLTNLIFNKTNSIEVTASLGLIDVPNTQNQFYILPNQQTVIGNESQVTNVFVTLLVKKNTPAFNAIEFVDGETGDALVSKLLGNLSTESNTVNTYEVSIPSGVAIQHIQAFSKLNDNYVCNTLNDGVTLNACSNDAVVNFASSNVGILDVQPNYVKMTGNYLQQVVTLVNIGKGMISQLKLPTTTTMFNITNNTCNASLVSGASCTFSIIYNPTRETGEKIFNVTYNNGSLSQASKITLSYVGFALLTATPESFSLNGAHQNVDITLTNIGGNKATNLQLPNLSSTALSYVNGTCVQGQELAVGASCTYNASYARATSAGNLTLPFNYNNGADNILLNVDVKYGAVSNYLYIGSNSLYKCTILESGGINDCSALEELNNIAGSAYQGMQMIERNNVRYVYNAQYYQGVSRCVVTESGAFIDCKLADFLDRPYVYDIVIGNVAGVDYFYSNNGSNIYKCVLTSDDSIVDNCKQIANSTQDGYAGMAFMSLSPESAYLYTNSANSTVGMRYSLNMLTGTPENGVPSGIQSDINYQIGLSFATFKGVQYVYSGQNYYDAADNYTPYVGSNLCQFNTITNLISGCVASPAYNMFENLYAPGNYNPPIMFTFATTPLGTTYAYLATEVAGLWKCTVDQNNGQLNNCERLANPNGAIDRPKIVYGNLASPQ